MRTAALQFESHRQGVLAFKMKGEILTRGFQKFFGCSCCGERVGIEKRSLLRPYCFGKGIAFLKTTASALPTMVRTENIYHIRNGESKAVVIIPNVKISSIYIRPSSSAISFQAAQVIFFPEPKEEPSFRGLSKTRKMRIAEWQADKLEQAMVESQTYWGNAE